MKRNSFCVLLLCLGIMAFNCGSDDHREMKANFTGSDPPDGGAININDTLIITFDKPPLSVTVNETQAHVSGKTARWHTTGLIPGLWTTLAIAWTNGDGSAGQGTTVTVAVRFDQPGMKPVMTWSNIENGDQDVDPVPLNSEGITFKFNESVQPRLITIKPIDGEPFGWIEKWANTAVTITPAGGKELIHGTTYIVKIRVQNATGNELGAEITFTTKE